MKLLESKNEQTYVASQRKTQELTEEIQAKETENVMLMKRQAESQHLVKELSANYAQSKETQSKIESRLKSKIEALKSELE